jgi:4a-hydroxytetrahydrobiopterin dehydratase
MTEEYSRHNGRAGLIPESAGGSTQGVTMTEPLTMRAFHADDRTRDWRVVGDGAIAVFRTGTFATGARLV